VAGEQLAIVGASILDAAIGVVDEAAGGRPACGQGHLERGDGEAGCRFVASAPADDAPAERVEDDREIGEFLGEMDIGG